MSNKYAQDLQKLIQFPTVSNHDESKMDFRQFELMHQTLETLFPLIHQKFTRTIIGRQNLLYSLKADNKNPKKEPLLFMAHQDVVPEGDHAKWKYPPFSGEIAEDSVWGRGSTDSKCNMIGQMEAVEALLAEGFTPDYDLYLAYGQDEECMSAHSGALMIKEYLVQQGVKLGGVFDECGGFAKDKNKVYSGTICEVPIGEKGYMDFEVYIEDEGGHSCSPGSKLSVLGRLAQAVLAIEENPMPYRLTATVKQNLLARSAMMSGDKKEIYRDPEGHWDALIQLAKEDKFIDCLLRTTTVPTMAQGSAQANILPEYASVIVNVRALEGDTIDGMQKHFEEILPEGVKVRFRGGVNPPAISTTDSKAYHLIVEIARELYGEVLMVPSLMTGGTDSRNYADVCSSVYRFCGFFSDESWGHAHQVNEHIPVESIGSSVKFFSQLLKRW